MNRQLVYVFYQYNVLMEDYLQGSSLHQQWAVSDHIMVDIRLEFHLDAEVGVPVQLEEVKFVFVV